MATKPHAIIVVGPWGSGTSAVAGLIEALGARSLQPEVAIGDASTPRTWEAIAFRDVLRAAVWQESLTRRLDSAGTITALRRFRDGIPQGRQPVVLKHALAALVLPELAEVFGAHFVMVLRSLGAIDATRRRRGWSGPFGMSAARKLYDDMFQFSRSSIAPTTFVRYQTAVRQPLAAARFLSSALDLGDAAVEAAAGIIRKRQEGEPA